jgi:hypothetical protein
LAGIGAAAAPAALPDLDDRFLLSCTGAMASGGGTQPDGGDPANRIVASAVVDLAALSVSGFGVGAAPIVVVTPGMIGFGTAGAVSLRLAAEPAINGRQARSGTIVEGSIDRTSGATTVIVHPASDPARVLIAMRLDCAMESAPG